MQNYVKFAQKSQTEIILPNVLETQLSGARAETKLSLFFAKIQSRLSSANVELHKILQNENVFIGSEVMEIL